MTTFPVTVSLRSGDRSFRTLGEITAYFRKEVDQWGWVKTHGFGDWRTESGHHQNNVLRGRFYQPFERLEAALNSGDGSGIVASAQAAFGKGGVPPSATPDGKIILAIAKLKPEFGIGAIYAACESARPSTAAFEAGAVMFWAKKAKALDFSADHEAVQAITGEAAASLGEAHLAVSRALERQRSRAIESLRRNRRHRHKVLRSIAAQHADAISSIQGVENSYLKQMSLQAPVTYWSKRSAEHQDKFKKLSWACGLYAIAAAIALGVGGFSFVRAEVANIVADQSPSELIFFEISLFLMLTTVAFWVGRVLSKLMLSERHLATDAAERAIMAETFLALQHDGAVSEAERPLVLAALFRNAPDGIVKDDGGGDPSLAALLARLLSPGGGR